MKAVILAAGKSSRFWPLNYRHKSLFYLMGKPLLYWNLLGLEKVGIKEVVIVESPRRDVEREIKKFRFKNLKIHYVVQPKPISTGNALWHARNFLDENFFLLNGDVLNSEEILKEMFKKIRKGKKPVIAGQKTKTPWLFGIMELRKDRIVRIVEKPKRGEEPSKIKNVGVYYLEPSFFSYYKKVKKGPADLIDALSEYMKEKEVKLALIKKEENKTPAFLKYPWHLFSSRNYLFEKYLKRKIESVKISKNVVIKGKVYIGKNTRILEGTIIKGPCYIGENCFIGNNSVIEEYTNIENNVTIHAFSKIKRSIIQKASCVYSSYVIDSIIGEETQLGENVKILTTNRDGKEILSEVKGEIVNTDLKSFGTVIGKASVIGTKVEILPGKFIGSNCRIHPNNKIEKNIKDNSVLK